MTDEEFEKQYAKAYNNGYMLEKHEPELFSNILKTAKTDSPYFEALQEGQRQQQRDQYIFRHANSNRRRVNRTEIGANVIVNMLSQYFNMDKPFAS